MYHIKNQHSILARAINAPFTFLNSKLAVIQMMIVLSIVATIAQEAIAQNDCVIRTSVEPTATEKTRVAANYYQTSFAHFESWDSIENIAASDNRYSRVHLNGYGRSTKIIGSDLNINLPYGAHIHGLKITFEGRTVGDGVIRETEMRLTDAQGVAAGESRAGYGGLRAWDNADEDVIWSYGGETDTWGLNLTDAILNDSDFGYRLQLRNALSQEAEVLIDQVTITVYYTPLYSICEHTCVAYYIEGYDPEAHRYNWIWPEGFELLSYSEKTGIINVGVSYADYGNYEICVEELENNEVISYCCRPFNYDNCTPAYIGDQVWNDVNANAIFDDGDEPMGNVEVQLFDPAGTLLSTVTTDEAGKYQFGDLAAGDYYVKLDVPPTFVPVVPFIGNTDTDSNLSGANGQYTTPIINVESGDSIVNIDLGLSKIVYMQGTVWEDVNGDGIRQQTEQFDFPEITVTATNTLGLSLTTTTLANDTYLIGPMPAGAYTVTFDIPTGFKSTLQNQGAPDQDSDIDDSGIIPAKFYSPSAYLDLDAGLTRPATIGDFVWEDLNFNGLQDDGEPGIADIKLKIYRGTELVDSLITDETGAYSFVIDPGTYEIILSDTRQYLPTTALAGDPALDSDLRLFSGKYSTGLLTILSNSTTYDLDFGLIDQPSTIGGLAYVDANTDGLFNVGEQVLANVTAILYNTADQALDTMLTDDLGFYAFEAVVSGSYYVIFSIEGNQLFTIPNAGGDDEADSDVTNNIAVGSTDLFDVLAGVDDFTIFAGYASKPSIGNRVWLDQNRDGIQDTEEEGINDITVRLIDEGGATIATTITTSDNEGAGLGYYLFENVDTGAYMITFEIDDFFKFAAADQGLDDVDSDVITSDSLGNGTRVGSTAAFIVGPNENNLDIDAGILSPFGGVIGKVFVDENANGINEEDDFLQGVTVDLFDESQTLIATTVTDTAGYYSFEDVLAGNYYVTFAISDRYVFTLPNVGLDDQDSDVTSTITETSTDLFAVLDGLFTIDIDAGLVDGASSISGLTWTDNNANGIRESEETTLADVKVKLFNITGEVIDSTETDAVGAYLFTKIVPGQYYIVLNSQDSTHINTIADQGSDDSIDDDVTSSIVANSTDTITTQYFEDIENIDAGYYQTATIGNLTWVDQNENDFLDPGEPGIDSIKVRLLDEDGLVVKSTVTAAGGGFENGYYQLTDITPGRYRLEFERVLFYQFVAGNVGDDNTDSDVSSTEANKGFTDFFDITSGEFNDTYDAGLRFGTPMVSTISGNIWLDENANGLNDSEPPRESLPVALFDQDGTFLEMNPSAADGSYEFTMLAEGFYYILVGLSPGTVATIANIGNDDTIDSDFTNVNGDFSTDLFFLGVLEDKTNVDLGVVNSLTIGDLVWEDSNLDGQYDATESGVADITVWLESETGAYRDTTITDSSGKYSFADIPAHTYTITFENPDGSFFTTTNVGPAESDSDANEDGSTGLVDLTAGGTNNDVDAGLLFAGSVNGLVFVDLNANGQRALLDPGLNEIVIELYDEDDQLVATTISNTIETVDGAYHFDGLKPGNYYVVFNIPNNYLITDPDKGNDAIDSDLTGSIVAGSTDMFLVGSSEAVVRDAGVFLPAQLGDRVWLDANMDGIQDATEEGVEGIQVTLYRSSGLPLDTTVTDSDGLYQFDDLKQGLYFIDFDIPATFAISPMDVSGDEATDSDADQSGVTPLISLAHGTELLDVDCGIFDSPTVLRSIAWDDQNTDGIRQKTEARLRDIRVDLLDMNGLLVDTAITNYLGKYAFANMQDGDYVVSPNLQELEYVITIPNMGDDQLDNDIMQTGASEMFVVDQGLTVPNIDIGLYEQGTFTSEVWEDMDKNAEYDDDELPLGGISVQLYDEQGVMQQEVMTTDEDAENVKFDKLHAGKYYVMYIPDEQHTGSVATGENYSNPNNSDLIEDILGFRTPLFEVSPGRDIDYLDAGFYPIDNANSNADLHPFATYDDDTSIRTDLQIMVGPNPALYFVELSDVSDHITEGAYTVIITDKNGVAVHTSHTSHLDKYRINLSHLISDTYYVLVSKNGETVTKQLIKVTP